MKIKKLMVFILILALFSSCQQEEEKEEITIQEDVDGIEETKDVPEEKEETEEVEKEDSKWEYALEYTNIPSEKTDEMHFRDRIRLRGEFPIDFIYGISQEEMDQIIDIAENRIREAGYWDGEEAICDEIARRYPGNSLLYPNGLTMARLTGTEDPHMETIYARERIYFMEVYEVDPEVLDGISDEEMTKAHRMAYRDFFSTRETNSFMNLVLYQLFAIHPELKNHLPGDHYVMLNYEDYLNTEKRPLEYEILEEELAEREILEQLETPDPRVLEEITDRELREVMYNIERKYLDQDSPVYGDIGRIYSELALLYGEIYQKEYSNYSYYGLVEDHLLQNPTE